MTELESLLPRLNEVFNENSNKESLSVEISLNELKKFAKILVGFFKPGDWIFLDGDLGTGKTALTREISILMGVSDYSTSPTFSLLNVETLKNTDTSSFFEFKTFIHIDLYRIKSGDELCYLGLESIYSRSNSICIFEWPFNISHEEYESFFRITGCQKPSRVIQIDIEIGEFLTSRIYTIKYNNNLYFT